MKSVHILQIDAAALGVEGLQTKDRGQPYLVDPVLHQRGVEAPVHHVVAIH